MRQKKKKIGQEEAAGAPEMEEPSRPAFALMTLITIHCPALTAVLTLKKYKYSFIGKASVTHPLCLSEKKGLGKSLGTAFAGN